MASLYLREQHKSAAKVVIACSRLITPFRLITATFMTLALYAAIFWVLHTSSQEVAENQQKLPVFLRDAVPNSSHYNIYQLITTDPAKLLPRHYCSIESFCRQNRQAVVWLLLSGVKALQGAPLPYLVSLQDRYPNLRLASIDTALTVKFTPLEALISSGALSRSLYPANHASDVMRLAAVYQAGGMYTDFDFICMRDVSDVRNAIMLEGQVWAHNGPLLFTRIVQRHCPRYSLAPRSSEFNEKLRRALRDVVQSAKNATVKPEEEDTSNQERSQQVDDASCRGVTLFNISTFMPVTLFDAKLLFKEPGDPGNATMQTPSATDSYTVHLFNKLTNQLPLRAGGGSVADILARTYCPVVYKMALDTTGSL